MTRPGPRDGGTTLVELLLVLAVLGIVVSAMTAATVVGLRTTDATSERLTESRGAQLVAAWLPGDVQSARTVTSGAAACGAGGAPVLGLAWSDPRTSGADVAVTVAYAVTSAGLERRYCEGGAVVATQPLVTRLDPGTAPVVTCEPSCAAARTVAVTVTEASGYRFDVSALRRAS